MKRNKIILVILILSMIALIFNGCGGGGTIPPISHSPTITSLTANPQSPIEVNQSTTIICLATDPDNDQLTYTWTKTGGTITGTGSAITWTAPEIEGTYITTCTVSDGELTDEQSISIDVGQDLPPDTTDPEPIEVVSAVIDLEKGGVVEVTDPENIISGVKLIIPSMSSNKNVEDSIATITISYIDDPYSLGLPDNRGFLLPPVVINSDVTLEVECILEIPYTEDDLSNMGLSSNENLKVYRYDYNSSSWEEVLINKRNSRDTSDVLEIIFKPEDIDSPYACTFLNATKPSDLGLPQPGDLLYKLSNYKGINGWLPGHVGIYVGEKAYDGVIPYNVIEALLNGGVQRSYYNPISAFSGSATYMGARQPESGALTSKQREDIVDFLDNNEVVGLPYAIGQSFPGIFFGMLQGNMVKGALGSYNCVGLAEKAYEIVGVNLVSDLDEGNFCFLPTCILTPAEQYNKTEPANKAKLNITIDPNPVPYSGDNSWPFNIILGESNGIGITLSDLIFEEYNQYGQKIYTGIHDEERITEWFGSNYIPAFSSIQWLENHGYSMDPEAGFAEYVKVKAKGIDDNGNLIEETAEIDLLPQ